MTALYAVLVSVITLFATTYLVLFLPQLQQQWKLRKHRHQLPPGPKVVKTGIAKPWLWFRELNEEYGDVVYLQMGQTPTIILGSAQAAWDLLEKRSSIYSSRPRFIVGNELLSGGLRGLMSPYNAFWRRWRKQLHASFFQRQSETYRPVQSLESKVLMHQLLKDPKKYRKHFERYAASVIVTVTYGRRVEDVDTDDVVRMNNAAMGRLTSVNIPGKYAVERYPALKYLPAWLAPWKAEVLEQRKKDIKMYTQLMDEVRDKVARNVSPDCFAQHLIQEQTNLGMTDLEVAYTAGSPFGAGVETSAGSIASFFLACVKFGPSFIPQAQAELDRVVGRDRMPTFDDMADLPYVRAVVAETLRWRPVAVIGGTAHASTADNTYRGYFIPKGSTVFAPLWSIHLNPDDFPQPHAFRPERFLEKRDYPGQWGHSAFGWGRRICPGMHLGAASVFINIARALWGFDIRAEKDEQGRDIEVDIFAFSHGFNSSPLPFACKIKPRSAKHAECIEQEWSDAVEQLKEYAAN